MILVVEDRYGIIQVNDSNKDITIKDLYKALGLAVAKELKCHFAIWNNGDMTRRLFTTNSPKITVMSIYKLLEFLNMPDMFEEPVEYLFEDND